MVEDQCSIPEALFRRDVHETLESDMPPQKKTITNNSNY